MDSLTNKVVFISGASRGIGEAIAKKFAAAGAKVVITGKSSVPHPKLPGTIFTVAEDIEKTGGTALAIKMDVREQAQITSAVEQTVEAFGGIDILVNNASAISLTKTCDTPMKRFDLMFDVNVRATFACSQAAIPYLSKSDNAHIINLAPPLNMDPKWFKDHVAYTMSKYGMSMCTLGMAEELKSQGIAVNSLWPQTTIATSAVKVHFPEEIWQASREPSIMADAALAIVLQDAKQYTGQFLIDETVLREQGIDDFSHYAINPKVPSFTDLFIDN